jgi:chromosome partitioning protein
LSPTEARLKLIESGFTFPKAAEKISFLMCKGGVGKTTSSYFLAVRLASFGARVLVIDTDPQANLTEAFHPEYYGFRLSENTPVLVDVLTGVRSIQSAILPLTSHLHILPSTSINSLLETKLSPQQPFFPSMLKDVLRSVERDYEYVIIDCAPALNLVNSLVVYASHRVILPVQLDGFSNSGLKLTLSEIADLEKAFKFTASKRILINNFNPREKLSFLFLGHMVSEYGPFMMNSTIRKCAEIKTKLTLRQDLFRLTRSKGGEDFDSLAREVLKRQDLREEH